MAEKWKILKLNYVKFLTLCIIMITNTQSKSFSVTLRFYVQFLRFLSLILLRFYILFVTLPIQRYRM